MLENWSVGVLGRSSLLFCNSWLLTPDSWLLFHALLRRHGSQVTAARERNLRDDESNHRADRDSRDHR